MKKMKIVAGLGSIDHYKDLAEAGADEVFCGVVPYEWNKKYGSLFPLNRREVLYYNVQICSLEEMKILKKMMDVYKVPVNITFNYLYYLEEQYEMIYEIMKELINIGFNEFIIADISLILQLNKRGLKCNIHLSGECAEINRLSIDFFNQLNISRYIFHRKNTIDDIKSCISNNEKRDIQYEAFILNERCHYTGGFCSSFHCDELEHLCKLPYEIIKINSESCHFEEVDKKLKSYYEKLDNPIEYEESQCSGIKNKIGDTGCGLCSLKKLKEAGVTHLKVVGRGNSLENMQRDIKGLKKAIAIIDEAKDSEVYEDRIKKEIINGSCSGECYY